MNSNQYMKMMFNIHDESDPVILDCGYLDDHASRDRADKVFASGVSRKRMKIVLNPGRIYVALPNKKAPHIIENLGVVSKSIHWGSTHSFPDMIIK